MSGLVVEAKYVKKKKSKANKAAFLSLEVTSYKYTFILINCI